MSNYSDILDAVDSPDRPIPDGFTNQWNPLVWNAGFVYRWSDVYSCWLDCEDMVTVKPNMTLDQAFEDRMDHPMWLDYAIFFPCDD